MFMTSYKIMNIHKKHLKIGGFRKMDTNLRLTLAYAGIEATIKKYDMDEVNDEKKRLMNNER